MKMRFLLMISLVVLMLVGCELTNPLRPPIITDVRFSPDTFDSYKANTSLRYTLRKRAKVSVWITNSRGEEIIRLLNKTEETKGTHSHGWLGIDGAGKFAQPGIIYTGWVEADYDIASATVEVFHY